MRRVRIHSSLLVLTMLALALTLADPAGAGDVPFGDQQVISTAANGAWSVFAADVDGNGDFFVLPASYQYNKIA